MDRGASKIGTFPGDAQLYGDSSPSRAIAYRRAVYVNPYLLRFICRARSLLRPYFFELEVYAKSRITEFYGYMLILCAFPVLLGAVLFFRIDAAVRPTSVIESPAPQSGQGRADRGNAQRKIRFAWRLAIRARDISRPRQSQIIPQDPLSASRRRLGAASKG